MVFYVTVATFQNIVHIYHIVMWDWQYFTECFWIFSYIRPSVGISLNIGGILSFPHDIVMDLNNVLFYNDLIYEYVYKHCH